MRKKGALLLICVIALLLLPEPARAEQPVTAKEIAGTWSGEATLVPSESEESGDWDLPGNVLPYTLNLKEDGSGTVEIDELSASASYQEGEVGATYSFYDVPMYVRISFQGTVFRDGDWVVMDVAVIVEGADEDGSVYGVYRGSERKNIPAPPPGAAPAEKEDIPTPAVPAQEPEQREPDWEDVEDFDPDSWSHDWSPALIPDGWDWDVPCGCEDDPWEKHAGPLATVIISIIAAVSAVLGGAGGSAAGAAAGVIEEALGAATYEGAAADPPDSTRDEGPPQEEEAGREGDGYTAPPDAGFGGPADNPFTNHQGGAGPGDCVRQGLPRYFINTASLNLVVQDTVFSGSGLGPELDLTLTYNSASSAAGIFGTGWSFSHEWLLEQKGNRIAIRKGSGQVLTFTAAGEGSPDRPAEALPQAGILHRLLAYGDHWLYREKGSRIYYNFDRVPGMELGRLTSIIDRYGNAVNLSYSRQGDLETVADAAGRVIRFTFNEQHRCTSFTLPDGRQASFLYDSGGRLVHSEDLMGIPVDYGYDSSAALVEMVVGKGKRRVAFSYRQWGRERLLQSFTNPNGKTTLYSLLSDNPRRVELTDPEGNKTIFQSRAGLTTSVISALGQEASIEYRDGLPVSRRDRNGGLTRWEYDGAGRLAKEVDPIGHAVTFGYDQEGNLLQITDPLGGSWLYRYNDQNSLLQICSPAGRQISIDYDGRGQPVALTGFGGQRITHSYDKYGNIIAIHRAGGSSSFVYDEHGYRIVSATDELGHSVFFEHDGNDRLIKLRHPDGEERSLLHDCCYALLATDERGMSRAFERDAAGNIIKEIDAAAATAEHGYDGNNNIITSRGFCGESTLYRYDRARRLSGITDALGRQQQYVYDAAGNLIALAVDGAQKISFQYDPCHRLVAATDSLGSTLSIERDALGRETVRRGARGQQISLLYDADGLLEKVFHDGREVGSYLYGKGGEMVEARDESGAVNFGYDAAGLLERIGYPGGWEISSTSNAAGLLETITYPGGLTVEYRYDNRLRPLEMSWPGGWMRFSYDAAGNLLREERSNGTESSYRYDENERMIFLEHKRGPEPFIERRNKLNAAGVVVEAEGFQPLEPPADGDLELSCNAADQIGTAPFRYDADGNLVSAPGWEAAYDAENRLVEFKRGALAGSCRYNSLNQRVERTVDGRVQRFYYDSLGNLMFEIEAEGKAPRCYLYCHGRPVAAVGGEGELRFYHYDQGGNTLALTGAEGAVAAAYAYSPFGRCLAEGDTAGNPFTFCGAYRVMDEGEGLYSMGRRFYAAAWGRFLQKDPLGLAGGVNSYVFAANNPLAYVEADGTFPIAVWGAFKIASVAVGAVTTAYYTYKAHRSSYNAVSELRREVLTVGEVNKVYQNYIDVCNSYGQFGGWDAKENAYKKYESAYNKLVAQHKAVADNMYDAANAAGEAAISVMTPDVLNIPVAIYSGRGEIKDAAGWVAGRAGSSTKGKGGGGSDPCSGTPQYAVLVKHPRMHY